MSLLADGLKNRPPTAKGETHNFIHLDMEFRTNTHKQSSHACSVEQRVLLLTDGLKDRTPAAKEAAASMAGSWLTQHCGGDCLRLLAAIDVQQNQGVGWCGCGCELVRASTS